MIPADSRPGTVLPVEGQVGGTSVAPAVADVDRLRGGRGVRDEGERVRIEDDASAGLRMIDLSEEAVRHARRVGVLCAGSVQGRGPLA